MLSTYPIFRQFSAKWLASLPSAHLAALAIVPYIVFMGVALHHRDWDASRFIVAGDHFVDRSELASPIAILKNSPGYDGEFYYRLALDPFTSKMIDYGITLDNPALRGARIGYPMLAWVFSFGQAPILPWSLIGLNLAALFAMAWASVAQARANGIPGWYGMLLPLYPGFILTLSRDTTEIVASTLALAAVSLALRRRFWWAALPACYAVITRETTLFYLAGFGLLEVLNSWRCRRVSLTLVPLALPALMFALWHVFIEYHWQMRSYGGTLKDLGTPFIGFSRFIRAQGVQLSQEDWTSFNFKRQVLFILLALMCPAVAALAGILVVQRKVETSLFLPWLMYAALFACLTTIVWIEPVAFLRAFSDFFVISAMILMMSKQAPIVKCCFAILGPAWLFTASFYAFRP
jgi:hypothetical protein